MNTSQATFTMVLLFGLRCLLPLVLMMGIGYAMNWMVGKWEMEAGESGQGTAVSAKSTTECFSFIGCDPEQRKECPGFQQQMIPCWLARTKAEGALPEKCVTCPLYEATPALA